MNISPKVVAGTSGFGFAGAITSVAVWIVSSKYHVDIPPEIASSITTIVSTLGGFVAGWVVPHQQVP